MIARSLIKKDGYGLPIEDTKRLVPGEGVMDVKSLLGKEGRFRCSFENITTNDCVVT